VGSWARERTETDWCICICLISCTESETYAHVCPRDGGPVFRAPLCSFLDVLFILLHVALTVTSALWRGPLYLFSECFSVLLIWYLLKQGAWGSVVVKGRSRDRSPVVSLGIFSLVPRQNHVPWGRLSLWKWVSGISPGVKVAGAFGWRPTTLVVPKRQEDPGP